MIRLATFNVENMFQRPAAMNLDSWEDGKQILEDFAALNDLIAEPVYDTAIKKAILKIAKRHPKLISDGAGKYIRLRDIRHKLFKKPRNKPAEVAVNGRDEWIGWFELVREEIKEVATENTARVVKEVDADILCVVEAEDRTALCRFSTEVLPKIGGNPYSNIMLIDGNDTRGIDVGIMTRQDMPIRLIVSHVHDSDDVGVVFSRDCAEYLVTLPNGSGHLLVMVNHFKSKGFGSTSQSNEKRRRQAKKVRDIYKQRRSEGHELIAIVGDLNEVPDGAPLQELIANGSGLVDIMVHPNFSGDGRPGTFGNGTKSGKLDYILMSPELSQLVVKGGIERRGVWGGKNGTLFPHFDEIKSAKDAASDHAALWVDLDL